MILVLFLGIMSTSHNNSTIRADTARNKPNLRRKNTGQEMTWMNKLHSVQTIKY
uniref:Uncharacterized protein n=1 Tax=Arion vulgaris TaxID=1028688 RepID=A0A0B7BYQ1_9EUPU